MDRDTIAKVAWYMPHEEDDLPGKDELGLAGLSQTRLQEIYHYAKCFKNMKLGWDFARTMRWYCDMEGHVFPSILHGDDLFIWRAYRYLGGSSDPVIETAVMWESTPMYKNLRSQIQALLVAEGVDCNYIAERLKLDNETVRAYEKLFFNVLDRKKDHAFIADLVYPEGRLVEGYEGYIKETGIHTLMLRAGYTHGVQHVLYASGLGKHPFRGKSAAQGAADLDTKFMADGLFYGSMGWLNQHKATAISNARMSMQASKMGGDDSSMSVGIIDMGDTIANELVELAQRKAEARARAQMETIEAQAETVTIG